MLFSPLFLSAQSDSTLLLAPERLEQSDILSRDLSQQEIQVISATRTPETIDEQPFTVWVITGEEILRNGFVTLGDVMRAAPGIRVSQLGNATEGEMFLMRGLSGNQYVKILINDVPIKPGIALGMPIGAQLPIRQAERIEVTYGPSGAIYGEEACVGVINIILKETERPVFTQADLSFGRYSYNSLDLMFGGKLGRDKNIFRYSIYGSSTVRENSDYYYDQQLFNTNNYLVLGLDSSLYTSNENYRGSSPLLPNIAKTAALPHESRMFGLNMTWRGLHFTYHRLARFDRTALGLNPLSVSYDNPSNRLAERMETFTLGFQRKRKKRVTYNTFSFGRYRIDNTSTTTYVFDKLSAALYKAQYDPTTMTEDQRKQLLQNIFDNFTADERFSVANGIDFRFESRLKVSLRPKLVLNTGLQSQTGAGSPTFSYYPVPVTVNVLGDINSPVPQVPYVRASGVFSNNIFAQLEYRNKHISIVTGAAINLGLTDGAFSSQRLGILYKIDSIWSVRVNGSSGFRSSSPFGDANSLTFYPSKELTDFWGLNNLKTEKFYSGEVGMRYKNGGFHGEILAFLQNANNLYRPGYLLPGNGIVPSYLFGYQNTSGIAQSLWGIQGMINTEKREFIDVDIAKKKAVVSGKTEFYVQFAKGKEWFGYEFPNSNEALNQPKWIIQWRSFVKVNKNVEFVVAAIKMSSSRSKSYVYRDFYQLPASRSDRLPKYTTWDLTGRVYLSNHFLVYFNVQNIFDKEFAGLDATGTIDDLMYNPQPGRFFRFGVNYNMN